MKRFFFSITFSLSLILSHAQIMPQVRTIILEEGEYQIEMAVYINYKRIKCKNDLTYHSYYKNQVFTTQGGYNGFLLHGRYHRFYATHALKEAGEIRDGLKHGIWKYWQTDGNLENMENWKSGKKHGAFEYFDEKGRIKRKGIYKDGKVNGKLIIYEDGKIKETQNYKSGKLLENKIPKKSSSSNSPKEKH